MNTCRSIIMLLCFTIAVVLSICSMYLSRYEGAKSVIDENRRIPLWYPYEISEVDSGTNVMIIKWNEYGTITEHIITNPTSRIDVALQIPEHIETFSIYGEIVCGKRELRDRSTGEMLGSRYFIFTANREAVDYFQSEVEYLNSCRMLGIDGLSLNNFTENYQRFWNGCGKCSITRIVESFCRTGFSKGELILLAVLIFFWGRAFHRVVRNFTSRANTMGDEEQSC